MRVAVVDDHAVFRVGLRQILVGGGHEVVGEAGSGREALQLLDRCRPEVLMMDIGLPGMDGVLTTREARRRAPDTRILIVTAHTDLPNVMDALDAGAAGFALKTDGAEALIEALARLQAGVQYLAPSLTSRLQAARVRRQQQNDLLAILSPREREIFRLAAQCLKAREIAKELCIARKTADTHLNHIYHKLSLRSMAELVRLAANLGMVDNGRTPSAVLADAI
ncbi:MAG TPA: response regulator transcription factor [Polyangia bacterium]|nr:response regulator transcription factor [Polyangia bacterium]